MASARRNLKLILDQSTSFGVEVGLGSLRGACGKCQGSFRHFASVLPVNRQ